ncbi:MAG: hypothetical protein RIN56_13315 [Sporomusaceae bacterium]|nr:hypothetical protein [Sporomusaceae bacterium]
MLDKAIEKIRDEMVAKNDTYVQVVGDMLLHHLTANPAAAEKVMASGKTIAGSLSAMRSAAEKKKSGNCAVLTDAEGFAVVLEYFGISGTASIPSPVPAALLIPKTASTDFDVSLDDLLRG